MIDAIADAGVLLQVRAAADTLLFRQVGTTPSVFERVASVASGLMSIALLALTVVLIPAAWNFRKSYKKVNELLKRIYGDINPLMRHASTIADNVDYITTSIRTDVQQLNATIATANQRLHQAMAITEQRLQEFNALLQVVQEEAEGMFVSTASTVRGVRTGAAAFRDGIGTDLAIDDDDDLDDTEADLMDDMEDTDGNDRSIPSEPRAGTLEPGRGAGAGVGARPRVRASVARAARMDDQEHQYDLLTAAVLGLTIGVGATLLLRRGPSGRRPLAPALMGMAKGAAWAGRGAARIGAEGGRWAKRRGGELWDRVPVEAMQDQVEEYLGRAKDTIEDAVSSELRDLRRAMRRQRRRLGI